MASSLLRIGSCFAGLLLAVSSPFAQVTDLEVTKSGNDVVLNWTTGTPNFRVLRSRTPNFMSGNATVAEDLAASPSTDSGAAATADLYFYQVIGSGEPSPGLFELNPARLVPAITMLTPNSGQPGITVTIDGSNFALDGSGMIVMFGDLPADLQSATATQILATVPVGAVTSDVVVCVVDVCSNKVRFTVTVGPTFQNISSLAFEPGTGSLWVGDQGAGSVVEIDSAGTPFNRAGLVMAFVSNPSPGDGTGRIYFGNGSNNVNNQGTIRFIDSTTNSNTVFRAAGTAMTDPVGARGLAARDSEPNVAYILDLNGNTVRRVPSTGLIDANWGNTALLSFNNPAGARFDSAGNLYVSSTTAVYKIAPNEAVTQVAAGFTGAAGIDLSEDTGIPTLLVADRATGQVYLVNTENGIKEVVGDGFTTPVAAAFSRNLTTGDLFYDVAEPTRIIRLADSRVEFALRDPTPVLIHKYRPEDQYPSGFQTEDGKLTVEATVRPAARPAAGVTVHFRLIDPKDKAPYASTGVGDNKGGPGTFPTGVVASAVSDAQGKVRAILTITDTYGGDNYQVEASLQPSPNFKKIARSGVFTAWKRTYVEYDRMYKVGEFVNQNSGAGQPDPSKVFVVNPGTFMVGEEVHVLSGTPTTQEGERRTVSAVALDHIVVNSPLGSTYTYSGPNPPGAAAPYSFVAKVSAGAYEILPTSNTLAISFTDPFNEWQFVDGGSFLPAWPMINLTDIDPQTSAFFKNVLPGVIPRTNHVQLVAAGALAAPDPNILGATQADNALPLISKNWSWVFTDTIQSKCVGCTGGQLQNSLSDVAAHELAHQWNVNPESTAGHDLENSWNDATKKCLMNQSRDRALGPARLHANLAALSKDLYCIRGHSDNLNQDTCTWPP